MGRSRAKTSHSYVHHVLSLSIGYKNIPVSIDDALKAVQAEKIVETIISARSAQRIGCVGGKVRWKD